MITPSACHGRQRFEGRPVAETPTDVWGWWHGTFVRTVPLTMADLGLRHAETRWRADGRPEIRMHYRLTPVQRTYSLAHELHHVAIGGVCTSLCRRNERIVARETVRWLLPDIEQLAGRLRSTSLQRVAHDVGLAPHALIERLDVLTPHERRIVDDVMQAPRSRCVA